MFAVALFLTLDTPTPDTSLILTLDLARLTVPQGHHFRVTFAVDSLPEYTNDGVIVGAEGPDDESRTIHFTGSEKRDLAGGTRHIVEGMVSVVSHLGSVRDGKRFPGIVEVKILRASR